MNYQNSLSNSALHNELSNTQLLSNNYFKSNNKTNLRGTIHQKYLF